ncbi:MAG: DUF6976 family protein [Myxococcota bacterium]
MNTLVTLEEAAQRIQQGRPLTIAGAEPLLRRLPRGRWIGGTIPYFMGPDGGVVSHDRLFVTELPPQAIEVTTRSYDLASLPSFPKDGAPGGCTFLILPAFSAVHEAFGHDAMNYEGLFDRPVVGWVAGFDLKELGSARAGVIDGATGEYFTDRAVALHVKLAPGVVARADIVNIFERGDGPELRFPEGGFKVKDALIDGRRVPFAAWLKEQRVDTRLPLVADYSGAMINVSVQTVDAVTGEVSFYAPVFPEMSYRLARPITDYAQAFRAQLEAKQVHPVFTCNCILNFLYGELEGKRTGELQGAITFGEIAFMLLNQTMVYLTFEES